MKLSYLIDQQTPKGIKSALIVNVDYDEETREVDFKSILTYDYSTGNRTDITYIMSEVFDEALDSIIDQINWDELYLANKPEPEPERSEMFHLMADISRMHAKTFYGIDLGNSFNKLK